MPKKKLGEHLLESHLIDAPQLEEALRLQMKTNELLGKIVQKLGFVTEEDVARALAEQLSMPFAPAEELEAARKNAPRLPQDLALKRKIFPLSSENGRLRLAMANPFDWQTVDEVAFTTGLKVVPVLATESSIRNVLEPQGGPSTGLNGVLAGFDEGAGRGNVRIPPIGEAESAPSKIEIEHEPDRTPTLDSIRRNELVSLLEDAKTRLKEGLAAVEEALSKIPPRED